jgi:poly(3-hydroxyoctanoate) depolymerase
MPRGDPARVVTTLRPGMLARLIPGARLHVVRGGGHLLLLERPDEMAGLVSSFLTA